MKKYPTRQLIFIAYWVAVSVLIWSADESEMPLLEKFLHSACFLFGSLLITLPFSETLFKNTLSNRKTRPFIFKFISMTICLVFVYSAINELFYFLEVKGVFDSTVFIDDKKNFWTEFLERFPGVIFINLILCGLLLYYEYSQLRKAHLESQLQVLHSQINPHFMFNVLNYIHILMQKDTELASELLLKYSETLRYQLYSGKKAHVKLEQEIQYLKNFIDVEKFRWQDKLDVECTWQIESGNKEIPPLMFIPFIENAFKHVSRSKANKGFIYIQLRQKGNIISLKVENSKSGTTAKKSKDGGLGLENIKKRLDILYAEYYTLTIKDTGTVYYSELTIHI